MHNTAKTLTPGLLIALLISIIAFFLHVLPFWPFTISSGHHPIESMTIAILLGIITNHRFAQMPKCAIGINFCSKNILYAAIVLLGAKLNISTILHLSWQTISIIVLCIVFAYFISLLIGMKMNVSKRMNHLIAFGTAICGSSAIAAIGPLVNAKKKEIVIAIAAINLFGTIAIFLWPIIGHYIQMTDVHFAIWSGTSIQAVPQVVASSFSYSHESGILGTTVKLVRVLFLAPMLFMLLKTKKTQSNNLSQGSTLPWYKAIPPFIILFFCVVVLFSINLPDGSIAHTVMAESKTILSTASDYLMILAMAAIGMQVSFKDLSKSAVKPVLLSGTSFILLACFSLLLIWVFMP